MRRSSRRMSSGCGAGQFCLPPPFSGALVAAMLIGGAGGSPALARIPAQPDAASFGSERLTHLFTLGLRSRTSETARLLLVPMLAQPTALDAQAAELRALVQHAPKLAYKKV